MAIGELKSVIDRGAIGAETKTFTIQPAAGEVWKVRGILASMPGTGATAHSVRLYVTDGTKEVTLAANSANAAEGLAVMWGSLAQNAAATLELTADKFVLGDGADGIVAVANIDSLSGNGIFIDNSTYLKIDIISGTAAQTYEYFVDAVETVSA